MNFSLICLFLLKYLGDLADPQSSIPIGTIAAQLTCSFIYLAFILILGTSVRGEFLRDKLGESQGGNLVVAKIAWPHELVTLIGAFCSTMGAALQCMCSAPRLLNAIANDDVIPILNFFKVKYRFLYFVFHDKEGTIKSRTNIQLIRLVIPFFISNSKE